MKHGQNAGTAKDHQGFPIGLVSFFDKRQVTPDRDFYFSIRKDDGGENFDRRLIKAFSAMRGRSAEADLEYIACSYDRTGRYTAVEELAKLRTPNAFAALQRLLGDGNINSFSGAMPLVAVHGLGFFGGPESVRLLSLVAADRELYPSVVAALARTGCPEGATAVYQALTSGTAADRYHARRGLGLAFDSPIEDIRFDGHRLRASAALPLDRHG